MDAMNKELTIKRTLNAPRALVFKAWTDPNHLAQWWGPHGFTNPVCELDLKPGGAIRIHMKAPDGVVYPMTGTFREIVEPEKIVFISAALDAGGKSLFDVLTTVTLIDENGKTALTMNAVVVNFTPEAAPYIAGMDEGWTQSLNRLEEFVMKH